MLETSVPVLRGHLNEIEKVIFSEMSLRKRETGKTLRNYLEYRSI